MVVKKIMCCCGGGMGSSLLVKMNVEKVLKRLNISGIDVIHCSVSDAVKNAADLFVVGIDLKDFVKGLPEVITIKNIMDINELTVKLKDKLGV
ncbi:MAG TPA: PTS sugar transporter subunit IIB [Erysipelotrichaceae bacterium]|nr:PTS sugar transporter subunit IIB [Erysipelotrichaceae bacterium]HQB32989.1 PTS sugar transporter subunit IIB [Erysipelotrichaceae bacterium]